MDEVRLKRALIRKSDELKVPVELDMKSTCGKGECIDLTREAVSEGTDVIAVAGGDGTIMEAVNSLSGMKSALGIIPIGSGNDTIVSISGHNDMNRCLADIVGSEPGLLDVGRMNGICFLNVVGLGLDAEINHLVAQKRELVRKIDPAPIYTLAAIKVLSGFTPYNISLSIDGSRFIDHTVSLCTIGNGTTCGGGYRLTPKAKMDDGILDLSISGYIGKIRSILNIRTAFKGRHIHRKENEYLEFRSAVIKARDGNLPYHIDGEAGFAEKVEVDIIPGGLYCVHGYDGPHLE
jgi:YegS/Rv2252/BmrU family lipid kinase